jgi:hypothetical protein
MTIARARTALLMWVAVVAVCAPQPARAAQVVVTITGIVSGFGADFYGNVFSNAGTSTDLTNDDFTLVYTIDGAKLLRSQSAAVHTAAREEARMDLSQLRRVP